MSGAVLTWGLIIGLALFFTLDILFYLIGWTTMSQYILRKAKTHKGFKWFAILFPLLITAIGVWLIFHFDSPGHLEGRVYQGEYIITQEGEDCDYRDPDCNTVFAKDVNILESSKKHILIKKGEGGREVVDYKEQEDYCKQLGVKCEPNWVVETYARDPWLDDQWNAQNFGFEEAWRTIASAPDIKVLIVDTGIDCTHPELECWDEYNTREHTSGEGTAFDDNGHGTHVAGIACALGNNGIAISGVAQKCKLIAAKALDSLGMGSMFDIVQAIEMGVDLGVDVINLSLGTTNYSEALKQAVERATNAGILVVAAAGNSFTDIDIHPQYPAALDNVITVGSIDNNGRISNFSNWGATLVEGAAPGSFIVSTLPGGTYGRKTGTSMSCPHIAGLAALLMQQRLGMPKYERMLDVKNAIINSALPHNTDKVKYGDFFAPKAFETPTPSPTPEPTPTPEEPQCKKRQCERCYTECDEKYSCNCRNWTFCRKRCKKKTSCGPGCTQS